MDGASESWRRRSRSKTCRIYGPTFSGRVSTANIHRPVESNASKMLADVQAEQLFYKKVRQPKGDPWEK